MLSLRAIAITCALTFASVSAIAGPPVYGLLKNGRSSLKLPHYSVDQKKLVLDQARIFLTEVFVHRELKIKDFGAAADPAPALNKIEKQIATLSDLDFHKQLSDIFYRLHDLHTLYYLPKPFACYESFLPFEMKDVKAANGKQVIAISGMRDEEAILKLMPKPYNIKIGDIVTKYNGMPISEAIKAQYSRSLGANPSSAKRKGLQNLRYYQHDLEFLPEKDSVQFELMNEQGEKYQINIPWITYTNWSCLSTPTPETKTISPLAGIKIKNRNQVRAQGHTDEPTLYWQINKSIYGNFGYIQLTSFTPDNFTNSEVVTTIKDILRNELKDTDGLMIDLRGNQGGQLTLAERLVQFFSPREVQPSLFKLRNSPATHFYMESIDSQDPFTVALQEADRLGAPFTKGLPISSFESINDMGQVYFKPVAVFVDSDCYSACDTFAAQVQDHQVATVFGEDQTTGGGGANVYSLNELLEDFGDRDTGMFKKLPNGQNMTFAFRQTFRRGINEGMLIEDKGIKVDRLSPPAMTDIFNATNDQLLVLQKYLKEQSPKYTSNIFLANEERQDFVINSKANFVASWNDTTSLKFKINGKEVETRDIPVKGVNSRISIPDALATDKVDEGRMEVYGSNSGKAVWRKVLNYRIIPQAKPIAANQIFNVSLANDKDVARYTHNTLRKDGWNISGNTLYVGDGSKYANDIHAEASIFVKLPKANYNLKFNASIKIETELDNMKIIAKSDNQEIVLLDKLSGDIPMQGYNVDLAQFQGKAVEIRFVFDSDAETSDAGISIQNISFAPAI